MTRRSSRRPGGRFIGHVDRIFRFPVKSMTGEEIREGLLMRDGGIRLDRTWAVRNLDAREQQGARKLPALLQLSAAFERNGESGEAPIVTFQDGRTLRADSEEASAAVSEFLGRRARLVPLRPREDAAHYRKGRFFVDAKEFREEMGVAPTEVGPDLSSLPLRRVAHLGVFATPLGTYFDAYPLHLLTTSSLAYVTEKLGRLALDPRRYRPNLVIDTGEVGELLEPGWEGATLRIGRCEIQVEARTIRCAIPGLAQPAHGIDADKTVVRTVAKHADRHLGAYATVAQPGTVRVGDPVHLVDANRNRITNTLRSLQRKVLGRVYERIFRGRDS